MIRDQTWLAHLFVNKVAHTPLNGLQAHHIGLHTRIHNQCIQDVEMALVKQLPKGGTLAQKMQKQAQDRPT